MPIRPGNHDAEDPIVCYCMRVHDSTIREAIAAGAHSVPELQDTTGACTGCGTCRIDLLALLRSHPAAVHGACEASEAPAARPGSS